MEAKSNQAHVQVLPHRPLDHSDPGREIHNFVGCEITVQRWHGGKCGPAVSIKKSTNHKFCICVLQTNLELLFCFRQ